jgi:asparaginyl-tRNA synthetase
MRIVDLLQTTPDNRQQTIHGWVRTRRDSKGGFSFIELNDGSCLANLQVVADSGLPNYQSEIAHLHPGAAIAVLGTVRDSPGGGQAIEVLADAVTVLGQCDITAYPLQKQRVSFERLREVPHLRARTNTFGAVARIRNALVYGTHTFYQERGFLHLSSPIITTSDCEGAGEMFRVSTAGQSAADPDAEFFGERAYLTVSGQLAAEAYACGLGNVYTFGPTFRAENSNTSRHLAEFWMIEPEIAFADLAADAALAEDYLKAMFVAATACAGDLAFFDKRIAPGICSRLERLSTACFERLSYCQAIKALERSGQNFDFPVSWGIDLQAEHERYLTEHYVDGPVVVTDFPRTIKPFYMRLNDDEKTVAAMDVLLPQIGELVGGSQREERLDVLTARMQESGLQPESYDWYLDLRRFGTVPHAGFGVGFERLVQFCTGMANIRDVIPFPRTPRNARC